MSKNPLDALPGKLGNNLGDYLREQRLTKKLSVRQLSAIAGISNPYLSQIERGVKRPSAEILQQIAKGLSISAETLYVQAGLLDPKESVPETSATTRAAIASDPALNSRQRQTMLEIYESFVGTAAPAAPKRAATKSAATKSVATKTTAKKKSAGSTKSSAASSSSKSTSARAGRGATTSSSTSTTPRRTP